ncbi:MAG: hypothetical protein U0802_02360 [Candidatus Binatia bacterium]
MASCLVDVFLVERVTDGMRRYAQWLNALVSLDAIRDALFVESPIAHPSASDPRRRAARHRRLPRRRRTRGLRPYGCSAAAVPRRSRAAALARVARLPSRVDPRYYLAAASWPRS